MRVTNLGSAKDRPGVWPHVYHAVCGTVVEFARVMNEMTQQREGVVWCAACHCACAPEELKPPGAVCLVFD